MSKRQGKRIITPGQQRAEAPRAGLQEQKLPRPPYWLRMNVASKVPCYVRPNWWRRFCMWALLGWTVEEDDGE